MVTFFRDIRFAVRRLAQSPGFSLTVICTLALGIGATTAIFSLVEGILLRPLPFLDPDRLVLVGDHVGNGKNTPVTAREIATYATANTAFSSVGAFQPVEYELTAGPTPEVINGARFTAAVFPTLGVHPILGREFTAREEAAHEPLAVISYALWLTRYHRDPHVIGSYLTLNRKTYTIIGVMPRDFEFPLVPGQLGQAQLWVPMSLTTEELSDENGGLFGFRLIARLKDGVSLRQAAEDANRVAQQAARDFPANMAAVHIRGDAMSLREQTVAGARPLLQTLFLAVSIVLVIACVNVATLLLVRAIRRRREFAVRLALGAQSALIVRQSLAEGLLLSISGGALGLAAAAVAVRAALRLLPESMPRIGAISVNIQVGAFALLLGVVTGSLCSLAPAFTALRTNLLDNIKDSSRTGSASARHSWLRSALVVAEIAIALVLLTLSGSFLRSYQKMLAVDPGFRPDHLLVAGYRLPAYQYTTNASVDTFDRTVLGRLASKPGIVAAGLADNVPASGGFGMGAYTVEGVPLSQWKLSFVAFALTYGDYFRAMDIPLRDGRFFTVEDGPNAPLVAIVNETMAKTCWPGQRAIGKRLHVGNPSRHLPWATVVGVVADTKLGARDEPGAEQLYMPMEQPQLVAFTANPAEPTFSNGGFIVIRSTLPPDRTVDTVRSTVASVDPQLALRDVRTMADALSNIEAPRRFNTRLISIFALCALLLAILGIYAVVAFSVSLRTQEIAIRMAVGAQRAQIARLVLLSGARLALFGCAGGLLASVALSRLVRSFLFEVSPIDPLIYISSALTMIALALAASAIPAARAASADPVKALRSG